jgi:hypothetical protein
MKAECQNLYLEDIDERLEGYAAEYLGCSVSEAFRRIDSGELYGTMLVTEIKWLREMRKSATKRPGSGGKLSNKRRK